MCSKVRVGIITSKIYIKIRYTSGVIVCRRRQIMNKYSKAQLTPIIKNIINLISLMQ
jgi:hypothetical protein